MKYKIRFHSSLVAKKNAESKKNLHLEIAASVHRRSDVAQLAVKKRKAEKKCESDLPESVKMVMVVIWTTYAHFRKVYVLPYYAKDLTEEPL
jgi:hypothetical protein